MKCEATVWTRDGWHQFPCTRNAKREVKGKHYCEQHAKVAKRRAVQA